MDFLERDLEDIIEEQLKKPFELIKRGLAVTEKEPIKILRQKGIGQYGISDIISISRVDNYIYVDLFELKKDKINIESLLQVSRYRKGIVHYLKERGFNSYFITVHLIGKRVDTSGDWIFLFDLPEISSEIRTYEYSYSFEGLYFKEIQLENYFYTNPKFKINE